MDYHTYQPAYDRDGFVIVRNFLPPDELTELTEELDRYICEVVPGVSAEDAFYQDPSRPETLKQLHRMGQDPYFEAYREHPRWLSFARSMLGESCQFHAPEWFNKPPGAEHATPPHQDNYYFCLRPPAVLTIWLALDRVDEENGCLRYVAGSHLNGLRPHGVTSTLGFSQGIVDYGPEDRARESTVLLEAGDMVCHHGETIHRADANRTQDRMRRAFAMVAEGVSCVRDEEAYERYQAASAAQRLAAEVANP